MLNSLYSLIVALAFGLVIEAVRGKDFHTFKEVKVRLKGQEELSGLQILEENKVLFDVDLMANYDLLPKNYFQRYHKEVKYCKLYSGHVVDILAG